MKRFEFRLERLLHIKEQKQRQAELHLQQTQAILVAVRNEIAELHSCITRAVSARAEQAESAAMCIARSGYVSRLGQLLAQAEKKEEKAIHEVQLAERQRVQSTIEVEALEHLRSKQLQAYRREAALAEQETMDERVLRQWKVHRDEQPQETSIGDKELLP